MPLPDAKFNVVALGRGVPKLWQNYPVRRGLIGSSPTLTPHVSD
jgi:hypothetical protein